jgi:hypothetical protein
MTPKANKASKPFKQEVVVQMTATLSETATVSQAPSVDISLL